MFQNIKTNEKSTYYFLFQIIKDTNMTQQNEKRTKKKTDRNSDV